MNDNVRRTALALLLLAACGPAKAFSQVQMEPGLGDAISLSGTTPESIILMWPSFSYRLARMMIAKYGQPAEASDQSLVWFNTGQWNKTVVYRVPPGGSILGQNAGRLEQNVAYRMPPGRLEALSRFDKEIVFDPVAGWLTVLSNAESDNFLALNLADEIIQGRRTPKEAAQVRRQILRLQDAGKSSAYLERLLFVRADKLPNPESPN